VHNNRFLDLRVYGHGRLEAINNYIRKREKSVHLLCSRRLDLEWVVLGTLI